jgi:hypothetical protein
LNSLKTPPRKVKPTMDEITTIIQSAGEKRKVANELAKLKAPRPATSVQKPKTKTKRGGPKALPAPPQIPAGGPFGCSRCRGSPNGCDGCRNPSFKGVRWTQKD